MVNMALQDFIFRPYAQGDEIKINEMFNEVFHQNRSLEHWYWKYRDNPYGSYKIALAVAPDARLAAHYGGYPVKVFYTDGKVTKDLIAYHIGDKMTRREFRGAGFGKNALLTRTFRVFQNSFIRDGSFGYGFGTHHSLRFGLMFLDYVDIEPVSYWRISIDKLMERIKISPLRQLFNSRRIRKTEEIDTKWDDFFRDVAPFYRLLIKRDARYLDWRYIKRPDREYLIISVTRRGRLSGWSVFFREGDRLIWGDALFRPDDTHSVRVLLSQLLKDQYCLGCETLEAWFAKRPCWWTQIISSLGFANLTEPSNLHLTGPITDPEVLSMIKQDFYYCLGDSDLF